MDKKASAPINTIIDSFRKSLEVTRSQFSKDTITNKIIRCAQVKLEERFK